MHCFTPHCLRLLVHRSLNPLHRSRHRRCRNLHCTPYTPWRPASPCSRRFSGAALPQIFPEETPSQYSCVISTSTLFLEFRVNRFVHKYDIAIARDYLVRSLTLRCVSTIYGDFLEYLSNLWATDSWKYSTNDCCLPTTPSP